MTEEEIKNLKPGDKFTVEYTVEAVRSTSVDVLDIKGERLLLNKLGSDKLTIATIVKPPPTFEVGDTVRIVPDPLTGTVYGNGSLYGNWVLGEARILQETARATEMKLAKLCGPIVTLNVHCLELVKKAVKARYEVEEDGIYYRVKDRKWAVAHFAINSHPNAEAAAKAECDRLNAEWRKSQEPT